MNFKRRTLTLLALLSPAALMAACSHTSVVDPIVVADVRGLVAAAQAIVVAVQKQDPKAFTAAQLSQIAALQASATAALDSLSAATPAPAGAALLQTIDTYLNAALSAIGAALPAAAVAFPVLATYEPMYDAAVALITGVLEPYINSLLTAVATPAPAARKALYVIHVRYSVAVARVILHIH